MNIGLSLLFCLGEPFPSVLNRLNEFDVDCIELVDESLHALNQKRVNALKKIARETGLEFTVHAPFVDINIASPNPVLRRVFLKRLEKSLGYARKLRCRQWVFHSGWKSGVSEFYPNLDWQTNLRSVHTLLTIAKKLEVAISIENTPEPMHFLVKRMQDFALFYSELGSDIGLTLDVAHAHTVGQELEFIDKFSDKITHVHISDNNGKYDAHRGIGNGNIGWNAIADALKHIGYKGTVMLESVDHVQESIQTMRQLFG
jgi:sugar phosphate isomerase/epimerase